MTKQLNRRDAMKRGGAALVATAAMMGAAAATSDVSDEALRDLWWRFIEAELRFSAACSAEDKADWTVRTECAATLICPWTPLPQKGEWIAGDCEISDHRNILQLVRTDTIVQQDGVGPWLVKEFQAPAANHHHRMFDRFRDGYPVRWQSYPNATTADEAYDMAKVRADKELRSYRAKSGAISRKHKRLPSRLRAMLATIFVKR